MHSYRRRYTSQILGPMPPGKVQGSRRPRTPSVGSSSRSARIQEDHYKKIRTHKVSFSVSSRSSEDRKVAPPKSNESVEESRTALPNLMSRDRPQSRGAESGTENNSSSLPMLAEAQPPQIAWNKTFAYVYDETAKRSKVVKPSEELGISLPVLVQYELTAEDEYLYKPDSKPTISQHFQEGDTTHEPLYTPPETYYTSPTLELLQNWNKTEKRNKGMHIMRWLVQVQN